MSRKWTQFWDMHSGGYAKTEYEKIYIQAEEEKAVGIFKMLFNQDPDTVACDCCGSNFSYTEYNSLEEATAYHRNCRWDDRLKRYVEEPDRYYNGKLKDYIPLSEYVKQEGVGVFYVEPPTEALEGAKLLSECI